MFNAEHAQRLDAMHKAIVNWLDVGHVMVNGYTALILAEDALKKPDPAAIAKGGVIARIAESLANIPITDERLVKHLAKDPSIPSNYDYIVGRTKEVMDMVNETLAKVPYSFEARERIERAQSAFTTVYSSYDFDFNEANTAFEIQGSPSENAAILEPFRKGYATVKRELEYAINIWIARNLSSNSTNNPSNQRVKWDCSTAIYIHIVKELLSKRYITMPGMNGKSGEGNITELFRRLSFAFQITGKDGTELSPDELQRRFNGRPLADVKAARMNFPEADEIK